uniref:Uncharacterized protein n=1 Tax=Strongyloides stercoralis TaxID=6248 RepID=A0A0K0EAZ4_STRER
MEEEKVVMCFFCRSIHTLIDEDIFKKFYHIPLDTISKNTVDEDGFKMPYIMGSPCKNFCIEQSKKFFYNIFVITKNGNLSRIHLIKEQLNEINTFINLMKNQNIPQSEINNFKILVCLEKNLYELLKKLKNLPKYMVNFFVQQFYLTHFQDMDYYHNFLTSIDYKRNLYDEKKRSIINLI